MSTPQHDETQARKPSRPAVPRLLLSDEEAAEAMHIGVSTFHELRKEEWFPRPIQLGPRLLRWSVAEIEQAIANMPRQQHASEPAQLLRGKINRLKGGASDPAARSAAARPWREVR